MMGKKMKGKGKRRATDRVIATVAVRPDRAAVLAAVRSAKTVAQLRSALEAMIELL